jgi:hypothetical protein
MRNVRKKSMQDKRRTPIEPGPEDFKAVERQYGCLPDNASIEQRARHYRLAQATKLIRLHSPNAS